MSKERIVELHLPSSLGYEKTAILVASHLANSIGLSQDKIERLKTAVAEATTNAIEHGHNLDPSKTVEVVMAMRDDAIRVSVSDYGCGRISMSSEMDVDSRYTGENETRGWGIYLIQNLVDDFEVSQTQNGNTVILSMYLNGE